MYCRVDTADSWTQASNGLEKQIPIFLPLLQNSVQEFFFHLAKQMLILLEVQIWSLNKEQSCTVRHISSIMKGPKETQVVEFIFLKLSFWPVSLRRLVAKQRIDAIVSSWFFAVKSKKSVLWIERIVATIYGKMESVYCNKAGRCPWHLLSIHKK